MNEEQIELMLAAKESIRGARLLLRDGMPGFAASRAYYAMFYVAKALLLELGLTHSKHSAVIAAFATEYTNKGTIPKMFHHYLVKAQDARLAGDYLSKRKVPPEESEELMRRADLFVEMGVKLLGEVSDQETE